MSPTAWQVVVLGQDTPWSERVYGTTWAAPGQTRIFECHALPAAGRAASGHEVLAFGDGPVVVTIGLHNLTEARKGLPVSDPAANGARWAGLDAVAVATDGTSRWAQRPNILQAGEIVLRAAGGPYSSWTWATAPWTPGSRVRRLAEPQSTSSPATT